MAENIREQLLRGQQFQNQLTNVVNDPNTGGFGSVVASFRSRRQANRNADLREALKQQEQQTRSRIIGQLSPEQRALAEEVDTGTLKSLIAKKLEQQLIPKEETLSKEATLTRDIKAGRVDPRLIEGKASEFEKAQQKQLGKQQAEDIGQLQSFESKFPELQETVVRLEKLSKTATFKVTDIAKDSIIRQTTGKSTQGALDREEFISIVDNQILPLLKDTFGSQFTEREGQTLRATLGNPNLSPKEKQVKLDAFIKQKVNDIKGLRRKLGVKQPVAEPTRGSPKVLNYNPSTGGFD